jgi:dipeptidyl aminopeptidase/acylaminoacyl peptidase
MKITLIAFSTLVLLINLITYNQTKSMLFFSDTNSPRSVIRNHNFFEKVSLLLLGIDNPKPINKKSPKDFGMNFETVTIKENQAELEVWIIKNPESKKVASFFHGAMSSKDQLLMEAKEFYDLGYNILLTDFRGSGGSNQNYTTFGFLEAEDVQTVVNFINLELKPNELILYGRSLGAAAITRAISKLGVNADKMIFEAIYSNLEQTIKNRFDLMSIPALFFPKLMILWANQLLPINGFKMNPSELVKAITIPTLFLHGELDRKAKLNEAKIVYEKMASEEKMFVIFENSKHEPYLLNNKKKWTKVISNFLK